jgi:endoribonuclease Dicer
MLFFMLTT